MGTNQNIKYEIKSNLMPILNCKYILECSATLTK